MTDGRRARAIVREVYPDRTVSAVTRVQQGNHKETALIAFEGTPTVVVQWSTRPEALRTEYALAAAVRDRTSIPVPKLLATGILDGVGYAVVERAPGTDLHEEFTRLDDPTQRALVSRFGRALAELHETFTFDGYGTVRHDSGDAPAEEFSSGSLRASDAHDWRGWFSQYVQAGLAALPAAFDEYQPRVEQLLATTDIRSTPPSRLYPWDLRPGNALVDDGELTAVLDWGDPLAADPGLAVAKAEYVVCDWYVDDGWRLRQAFHDGYESVRPLPPVPDIYRVVAAVHSAVDSTGVVTRPGFPEREGTAALAFHTARLDDLLDASDPE